MRILIFTAMHERHIISRLWCIATQRFIKASPSNIDCSVLAVVTHDESVELCNEFGFNSIKAANNPLGAKFNSGMFYALNNFDFDYVIITGDDDIISNEAWKYYSKAISDNIDYSGFGEIYFWNPSQKTCVLFDYKKKYSSSKLIGCGRLISRKALINTGIVSDVQMLHKVSFGSYTFSDKMKYTFPDYKASYLHGMKFAKKLGKPYFSLWKKSQNNGLDHESEMNFLSNGFIPVRYDCDKPLITDIKSNKNIWKIEKFINIGKLYPEKNVKDLLSQEELNFINENILNSKQ